MAAAGGCSGAIARAWSFLTARESGVRPYLSGLSRLRRSVRVIFLLLRRAQVQRHDWVAFFKGKVGSDVLEEMRTINANRALHRGNNNKCRWKFPATLVYFNPLEIPPHQRWTLGVKQRLTMLTIMKIGIEGWAGMDRYMYSH